jgi:murein DD-endopeptidase MepM/ murein hydrolase activator NlpD
MRSSILHERSNDMSDRRPPVERYAPIEGRRAWLAPRSGGARLHAGVDLAAARGTPVYAPADGRVVGVVADADATPGWRGYGPAVVVMRDDDGAHHVIAHVARDAHLPARGDIVRSGARIGTVSSLAHVHWEVRALPRPPRGVAVVEIAADPVAWMAGRIVRWDGRCPPAPANDARTPRACRPSWSGPPPPMVPWPSAPPRA